MKTADCIDRIDKVKKRCTDPDGNKFCFEFREDHDNVNHTKPSESTYWFNAQKRGVPAQPSRVLPLNNVTQNCEFYCSEKLPGLFTSKEPDWSVPVSAMFGATPIPTPTHKACTMVELQDIVRAHQKFDNSRLVLQSEYSASIWRLTLNLASG